MKRLSEDTKTALALAALVLGIGLSWAVAPDDAPAASIAVPERCQRGGFPTELWSARPGARPCNQVSTLEDGSGWLTLGTARRAIYRCEVPSPFEEGRTFSIKCRRIGR